MRIWYHGTNGKFVREILLKGFKKGTFFAKHVEDALHYGGPYIFEVLFEDSPTENWQYVSQKKVPVRDIIHMYRAVPKLMYQNTKTVLRVAQARLREENPKYKVCRACEGRGQLESYRPFSYHHRTGTKFTVCPKCKGFGSPQRMQEWQ